MLRYSTPLPSLFLPCGSLTFPPLPTRFHREVLVPHFLSFPLSAGALRVAFEFFLIRGATIFSVQFLFPDPRYPTFPVSTSAVVEDRENVSLLPLSCSPVRTSSTFFFFFPPFLWAKTLSPLPFRELTRNSVPKTCFSPCFVSFFLLVASTLCISLLPLVRPSFFLLDLRVRNVVEVFEVSTFPFFYPCFFGPSN